MNSLEQEARDNLATLLDPNAPSTSEYAHHFKNEPYKTYTDRDLIELACRASACPEWFEPDMSDYEWPSVPQDMRESCPDVEWDNPEAWPEWVKSPVLAEERSRRAIIQWPKAYARMVLESK